MDVWERFLQAVPPAPYHHVLAMKMRVPEWIYGLMSPTTSRARAIEIWWEYSQGG